MSRMDHGFRPLRPLANHEAVVEIMFESRPLYVAPRKRVLSFARIGDEKSRCYVKQDALIEPARGLREDSDVFQRCLPAFDEHRGAIESAAARLIKANKLDPDGAVTISGAALSLEMEPPLGAPATPSSWLLLRSGWMRTDSPGLR